MWASTPEPIIALPSRLLMVSECVVSPQNFLCYRTRGIIVGPQHTSFICVLVSLVCQRPMRRVW